MNAFAGVAFFDSPALDARARDCVANAIPRRPGTSISLRCAANAIFVQRTAMPASARDSRQGSGPKPSLFVAAARIDNPEDVLAPLTPGGVKQAMDDETLVRESFESAGAAGLARIVGAFAFVHWDVETRTLVLGRDYLGKFPVFFYAGRGFVAFASSYNSLFALPWVPREIDEVMLGHFLALNLRNPTKTLYRGVERVPSRSLVTVTRDGLSRRHYWTPNMDPAPLFRREEDYVVRGRELLDQAVATALGTDSAALTLSGGLDSSAIAATAAQLGLSERLDCYTSVAPSDLRIDFGPNCYPDERGKVEALARRYPQLRMHYDVPPQTHPFETDPAEYFRLTGIPVRNASVLGQFYALTATASAKHRILLDGYHGNMGFSWAGDDALFQLLRGGRWPEFLREFRATARNDGRGVARTLYTSVLDRALPHAMRRLSYRLRGRDPDSVTRYSALNQDFIADHDLPAKLRADDFDPWFGDADPRRGQELRAYCLFDHNQYARDGMALEADALGIARRSPLADRRLLEFLLRVPETLFRKNGIGRHFARRVLADRLPPEIVDEQRRGVPEPVWFRALDTQRERMAQDIETFEASPLASRILDLPRLKRLIAEWPRDEVSAQSRARDYQRLLARGVHVGRFVRWVEGGNA